MWRPPRGRRRLSLRTPRLTLEPLGPAHAPLMFDGLQDAAIYEWISGGPPPDVAALTAAYARLAARAAEHPVEEWLAWAARLHDGTCIGKLDANVVGREATNVGYLLFPPFWGHGYATEAVRGVVEHLAARGVTRFRATVTVGNRASARVLEKAGFAYTRTLADNDTIRGVPYDDWEYTLVSA